MLRLNFKMNFMSSSEKIQFSDDKIDEQTLQNKQEERTLPLFFIKKEIIITQSTSFNLRFNNGFQQLLIF